MLKQAVFTHILSREAEEETEENKPSSGPEGPTATCDESGASTSSQKDSPHLTSGLPEATERNGEATSESFLYSFSNAALDESRSQQQISSANCLLDLTSYLRERHQSKVYFTKCCTIPLRVVEL